MPEFPEDASIVDRLLAALGEVYTECNEKAAWEEEKPIYAQALPRLIEDLQDTYLVERPLKLGSTATVWILKDKKLEQLRALKLPRPRLSRLRDIVRVIRAERQKLATLNHQNIIKIYTAGELRFSVEADEYSFPYFVMEFLDGVQDLGDFIKTSALTCSALALLEYVRNVLAGLTYLHEEGIVHCDIKPGNILIARGRPALITDFGYAKHFPRPGDPTHKTEVTFTLEYGHPDLVRQIKDSSDKNASIAEIAKKDLKKQFDLYALGRTLLEVLRTHIEQRRQANDESSTSFTPYQRQFVSIVAKRLLDGCVERVRDEDLDSDMISGLAKPVMEEIKYHTSRDALADLEKLLDLYSIEGDVSELNPHIANYVQIPDCRVPLTSRVEAVINHPTFTRLAQITQLGFVSLVYPGAAHTRYEHVLGTFAHCCEYVRALWHDQGNPLFQCLMNSDDVELLLVAALLHDIGQYPMAHDLTEVASEFAHEHFNLQLLEFQPPDACESLADLVAREWGVWPNKLVDVWLANSSSSFKCRLFKSIISGPLDCDKIDYVRRDSTHLGVTFGLALDHERLLRNITVAYAPRTDGKVKVIPDKMDIVGLGVAEKALVVAESLARSRKDLFTQVYWHHTVRSLKVMLAFVVRNTLLWLDKDENREKKEEFWSTFHGEMLWLSRINCAQQPIVEKPTVSGGELIAEDEWLGPLSTEGGTGASGLNPGDDALLLFFRRFAPPREQQVIDAIRGRRLFKRLYVLTFSRAEVAYNQIYDRFRTYRLEGKLNEIERLRKECENRVKENVLGELDKVFGEGAAEAMGDIRSRIETADPLILLDVPVKAVSPSIEKEAIYYMPEQISGSGRRREDGRRFFATPVELEQTPFDKDVGKIRLFSPPDLKDVLLDCIPDHHEKLTEFLIQ